MPLYEFQKIFSEIRTVIDKYCPNEDIWRGFNDEED